MSIPSFSVRQPVLVNLVAIFSLVLGYMVLRDMTRESIPAVPTGWCQIITLVPGASAEEVEQLVTVPLESAAGDVDNIEQMFSTSREGLSSIFIQFEPSVEDVGRAVIEVSNQTSRVVLPDIAEEPLIREFKVTVPTLALAIRGAVPERVLREVALDLVRDLREIDGIAEVGEFGVREREVRVEVDPDRTSALGVPITAVADALETRAFNIPAGTIESPTDTRLVRGMTRVVRADDIANVVVRPDPLGGAVHVGDLADVIEGFADPRISGRVNGEPATVLMLRKDAVSDSLAISRDVRAWIAEVTPSLPTGVSIQIFGDAAPEVARSLDTLYGNAATGLLLVIGLLWFFVGGRNATMAALGVPVALAGAVIGMQLMGITINVISLLALILCLGVVVDDAIIIIENIYRHMEEGMPRREAAVRGTMEVFWPVVASTATTCAAFLPLLLMTGVLGEFFSIIPKVVIVSLLASLVEAMLVLPSHMADFARIPLKRKAEDEAAATRPETRWERLGRRTNTLYRAGLEGALRFRWPVILASYALTVGLVVLAAKTKDVVLFTDGDVDMFDVRLELPTSATREQTDAVVHEVERRLLAMNSPDIEATVAVRGITRNAMGVVNGDNVGMVTAYMKPAEQRTGPQAGRELLSRANRLFDDLVGPSNMEIVEHRPGPPRGAPVAVRVFGEDLDQLVELNDAVQGELQQVHGITTMQDNWELGRPELQVVVDEERAALHMLTAPMVTGWLARAFGTTSVATAREGRDEVKIYVRIAESVRQDPSRLEGLEVPTPTGALVALRELADVREARGPQLIQRHDQQRMVATYAQIDEAATTSQEVNRQLQARLAPLMAANPDVQIEYGGQYEETSESLDSLMKSFVVAILLIYTILATIFRSFGQPLIVMAAIPLSFIGVTVGFFATNSPIGMISLIGVVGLAGIVVNDSLVLVDFINERRRDGLPLHEAVVTAAMLRLRPIFLTTITTVAGLFPLAMSGAASPLLSPMANAICWGLSFATILTLVLIPCLYYAFDDLARIGSRIGGPFARWFTDPGGAIDEEREQPQA
ncbi:MAG: efflux RND transporter permease subunit [Sandaracinaceae bacterium]|nr:efflux RND transporter permease subunit [Sandaracinaceae bacterium]